MNLYALRQSCKQQYDILLSVPKKSLKDYLEFVKFEHTIFALPFAYAAMLLAKNSWPGWQVFIWITIAMIGARTASMALNRVIDAKIDAKNPRTKNREIPAGILNKYDGIILAIIGFALLIVAGWQLNRLTLFLLPIAVFFLSFYPYTKRFTWLCHYWLGLTIGASAAGGWIAVTGSFAPAAIALWIAVALWIAGFDIIYALLDYDFDIANSIHSVPAKFGIKNALIISAISHVLAVIALLASCYYSDSSGTYAISLRFYTLAIAVVAGVLVYVHWLVNKKGAAEALKSFNANMFISPIILISVILDLVF